MLLKSESVFIESDGDSTRLKDERMGESVKKKKSQAM